MLETGAVTYPRYVVSRWVSGQLGATRRFACSAFRCGFLAPVAALFDSTAALLFCPKSETHASGVSFLPRRERALSNFSLRAGRTRMKFFYAGRRGRKEKGGSLNVILN